MTIHRRFQILLCSLKRACSNITMSNFQIKHSPGYRHCIGETKLTSKKVYCIREDNSSEAIFVRNGLPEVLVCENDPVLVSEKFEA